MVKITPESRPKPTSKSRRHDRAAGKFGHKTIVRGPEDQLKVIGVKRAAQLKAIFRSSAHVPEFSLGEPSAGAGAASVLGSCNSRASSAPPASGTTLLETARSLRISASAAAATAATRFVADEASPATLSSDLRRNASSFHLTDVHKTETAQTDMQKRQQDLAAIVAAMNSLDL